MIDLLGAAAATPAAGTTGETPEAGFDAVLAGVLGGEPPAPEQAAAEDATASEAATTEILAALATLTAAGTLTPLPPLAGDGGDAVVSVPAAPSVPEDTAIAVPAEHPLARAHAPEARPAKAQRPKPPHTPNASERALVVAAAHSAVGRLAAAQAAQAAQAVQAVQAVQASVVMHEAAVIANGDIHGGATVAPAQAIEGDTATLPDVLPGAAEPVVSPATGLASTPPGQAEVVADTAAPAAQADGAAAEVRAATPRKPAEPRAAVRPDGGMPAVIGRGDSAPAEAFPAAADVPAPQAAAEAFTATALHRVLEAAEAARERAPQAMTVEIGGEQPGEEALRLVISVRGHTVNVAAHGGGSDGSLPPAWGRDLAEALHQRGLELGGQGAGERQASGREGAEAARPQAGAGRAVRAIKNSDDGALRL